MGQVNSKRNFLLYKKSALRRWVESKLFVITKNNKITKKPLTNRTARGIIYRSCNKTSIRGYGEIGRRARFRF